MSLKLDEVWNETLDRVRQKILRPSFETWLRTSRPVELDEHHNNLVVGVPHEFAKHWVQENYADALQEALSEVVGGDLSLSLVVTSAEDSEASPPHPPPRTSSLTEAPASKGSRPVMTGSSLNPKYTFANFVVGNSNRLSHAASLAVAESPARAYNPLFIYGGVGLGKTHLMQAVAHSVLRNSPSHNVVYVSSERFANELINSIRDTETVSFRNRYRTVGVLLIDDIQFLAGKERTQEEFFHTFNTLHEANRQIVISSDRPPKEIPTLEERLRSRFEWGLISDIQPPDLETRIAILRKKAATEHLNAPDSVLRYIAENITSNIRELEGALIRLVAFSSLHQQAIDMNLAEQALRDLIPKQNIEPVTVKKIQEAVAARYDITISEMKGKRRTQAVVFPRQVAMYLARELTDSSLPQIGQEFGGRDHSTVIHACRKISDESKDNLQLKSILDDLKRQI
ncbi:MAG: chromosomal replication initiator protein DnaA [Bacillota bacterium]